ncbi:MAG: hypothetical protein A2X49_03235 [Lentisphaerae bacterium GWF2_52_8]|nr:MAG: hypothetical protein A2X49_03235 [Lentisphaerae bacterium GWF2_52_8]
MNLTVDVDIPYGNASQIELFEDKDIPEILFSPDPHGGPEAMWFCFRVENSIPGECRRLRLIIKNYCNLLGAGNPANLSPVICPDGASWQRLGPGRAELLPDGRVQGVWEFDFDYSLADFALCFPYGRPEIEELAGQSGDYWKNDVIGVSQQARHLMRMSNSYGAEQGSKKLPGIYAIARQHSGETPGSWVLHGFMKKFGEMKVKDILLWSVPLSNIDGIENGDYGKDNFPYDLNRAWGCPPMRHETLVLQRDMWRWQARCSPTLALDFHGPGLDERDGIYAFLPGEEGVLGGKIEHWAEIARKGFGALAMAKFAHRAKYASRWETPNFTRFCLDSLSIPALSFETPYSFIGEKEMGMDDYIEAGGNLAVAVVEFIRKGS